MGILLLFRQIISPHKATNKSRKIHANVLIILLKMIRQPSQVLQSNKSNNKIKEKNPQPTRLNITSIKSNQLHFSEERMLSY